MVPHMNELDAKFGPRGLSIVGVTSESKQDTEKWIRAKGAKYAYAYDKGGALSGAFGVRGIPHAVLVDPSGTILWRGHPGQLDESELEAAVSGALQKPLWALAKDQVDLRRSLVADDLAAASKAAEKAGADSAELVRAWIAARVVAVKAAIDRGDYRAAMAVGERAEKALAGLPEAGEVEELLAKIKKDPKTKEILRAQQAVEALELEALTAQGKKKTKELIEKLEKQAADHPGTIVAERAQRAAAELKRRK